MVVEYLILLGYLAVVILFFAFCDMMGQSYIQCEMERVKSKQEIGNAPEGDGFFMAAMYQDMGNDL